MSDALELNDEQRKIVEENIKLVYFVVTKHYPTFINDQDIISSGFMGLCQAALTWDKSKGTFPTWGRTCVRNAIRKELRYRQKLPEAISIDAPIEEDLTVEDILEGREDMDVNDLVSHTFCDTLTSDEMTVFKLKTSGYNLKDIEQATGYSQSRVQAILKSIRIKYLKSR